MDFKIKVYTDPGHGWGAVKRRVLVDLNILQKITPYSYQKGATVYLEEDCDLSTLVAALKEKGYNPVYIEKHTDNRHPIRSYSSFRPESV